MRLLTVICAGIISTLSADNGVYANPPRGSGALLLDVVLEEIDVPDRIISVRSWFAEFPARPGVGGVVHHGTRREDRKNDFNIPVPTRLQNLRVVNSVVLIDPQWRFAKFEDLRPEMHVVLEIAVNEIGMLVVSRIEGVPFDRIGVNFTDALPTGPAKELRPATDPRPAHRGRSNPVMKRSPRSPMRKPCR